MSTVDNRVVQMEFDNKEFEQGIQTSIKSIENLEKSLKLDEASKGLTNIEKTANSISFGGLSSSVESINWHFTWLGRTVDRVLDNITNKALSAAKNVASAFTTESFSQGYEEYELKMGSIQTIMAGTGESLETVSRYLDELNTYADKTIYSFSDMTTNIGKFTNAGVDLDRAVKAIQGVSNVAAVSGANTNEASRAMYNFAQALSAGYVKLIDWKSIENANMATVEFKQQLIDTAVAMGTLTESADGMYKIVGAKSDKIFNASRNFNEYLSEAWLTNDVLIKTLGDYADETSEIGKKAFAAAQDVKTFTQLMDTLKEAMGSGWARTFELVIGDFNQAKEMFTNVSNVLGGVIDDISSSRNELLESSLGKSNIIWYEDWMNLNDEAITKNQTFMKSLRDTAKAHGIAIDEMIRSTGSFENSLKKGWLTLDILNEALDSSGKEATTSIEGTTKSLDNLKDVANKVIKGEFGNGEDRVKALTEAGYDYAEVQGIVNKILSGQEVVLEDLSKAEMKQMGYTEEQIAQLDALKKQAQETNTPLNELIKKMEKPSGRDLLIDSVKNAFTGLVKVITSVRDAYRLIFPPMTSDRLYSIIEGFNKFTKSLIPSEKTMSKLGDIFKGFFSVIDIGKMAFSALFDGFKNVTKSLRPLGDVLLDIGGKIGNFLYGIRNAIKNSNVFGRIVGTAFKLASFGFEKISNLIKMVSDKILGLAKDDSKGLGKFVKGILDGVKPLSKIGSFVKDSFKILETFKPEAAIKIIGRRIKTAFNRLELPSFVKDTLSSITEFGKNIWERIRSAFKVSGSPLEGISNFVSGIKDRFKSLSGIRDFISRGFEGVKNVVSGVINWIRETFPNIFEAIGNFISGSSGTTLLDLLKNVLVIDNLSKFSKVLDSVSGVVSSVVGILDAVKKSLVAWTKEIKVKILKSIAIAIALIVGSIVALTLLDNQKIYDAMSAIGIILGGLVGAMYAFDRFVTDGKKLKDMSKALVPLAASILIFAFAIGKFAKMDNGAISKGLVVIGAVMTEMALFTRLANSEFKASNGIALMGMALGISLMVGAISKFSKLDVGAAVTGMMELAVLLTEIGVFTRIASKGFKISNSIGLLSLALALGVFVGTVKSLAKLDVGAAVTGMMELAVLLTEIGVFTRIASKAKGLVKTSLSLVVVGGALHVFISAIKKISSIPTGSLAKGLLAIGIALAELSIATRMMSGANSIKGAASITILASALYLLIPLFQRLGSINNIAQTGIGLSAVLLSLSASVKMLNGIPVGGGLSAAETLGEIVAGIAAIVAIAGGINQIPGANWLMQEGGDFLQSLGTSIGQFIGGILGGVGVGMAATLPAIGQYLSDFMVSVQGFVEGASAIGADTSAMNGIETISSMILKLTASELLDALTSWVTGGRTSLSTFGNDLVEFGPKLSAFADSVSGISQSDVENAAQALKVLLETDVPKTGGLVQAIVGETNFEQFGAQLASFGPNLKIFSNSITGINDSDINAAASALSSLMSVDIGETGGFIQVVTGTKNFQTFGVQLASFGPNLAKFAESVSGISSGEGIQNATNMLAQLLTLEIPETGGFIQAIVGEKNFGEFGKQLASFGPNLAKFSSSISGITSPENMTDVLGVITDILGMDVPENTGFLPWLKGITDFGEFGDQLSGFGSGLSRFFTSIGSFDATNLGAILDEIQKLADMSGSLAGFNLDSFWNFGQAISQLGGIDLTDAIEEVNSWDESFSASGKTLGESVISGITDALGSESLDLSGLGESFVSSFTASVESSAGSAKGQITSFIDIVMVAAELRVNSHNATFKNLGIALVTSLASGVSSKTITSEAASVAGSGISGIKSYYSDFRSSGQYLMDGLINGIKSKEGAVKSVAKGIADVANNAIKNALKIASPSKVTEEYGRYFDLGFANGLSNYSRVVANASKGLASDTLSTMAYGIERVQEIANSNMDFTPTIRPVVDLDEVSNGINQMNTLFNQNGSISLGEYPYQMLERSSFAVGTSRDPSSTNVEFDNREVVSAISELRSELASLKGAIGSMKVVTETDALVGQIKYKVDRELGMISNQKKRGM